MLRWIAWLLLAFWLPAGCGRATEAAFTTLARGVNSGITTQEALLITNQADWTTLWTRHTQIFVPPPEPPPVDFAAESVVTVFLGERRTGGYSVVITGMRLADGELRVAAEEREPAPGAFVTMALTQPYHIVRIPRVEPGTRLKVSWQTKQAGLGKK